MKQPIPHALGAALAVLLFFAPVVGVFAGNTINITTTPYPAHDICGNSANNITWDCNSFNDSDTNKVTIGAGVILGSNSVYGRWDEASGRDTTANGNTVVLNGTVGNAIIGGYAWSTSSGQNAEAKENQVSVSGPSATTSLVHGGYAFVSSNATSTASSNKVDISGGTVSGATGGHAYCGGNGTGIASNNTVSITGGTVSAGNYIYGGYISNCSTRTASNNTVTIGGSANISGVILTGGFAPSGTSTGNTLNLQKQISVGGVWYFQNLNFSVPSGLSGPMLTVGGTADIANAKINVSVSGTYAVNDQITLIQAGTLTGTPASVSPGWSVNSYGFELVPEALTQKKLVVKVVSAPLTIIPSTPPTLTGLKVDNTTSNSADFSVTSDKNTTGYWKVVPGSDPCPAASALATATGVSSGKMSANSLFKGTLTGLSPSTAYKLCFVAGSLKLGVLGAASAVVEAPFTTPAAGSGPQPPALSKPEISNTTSTGANFTVTSNQDATAHWQVIENKTGATCPAAGDPSYVFSGTMEAGKPFTGALSLKPETDYLFCFYAENAGGLTSSLTQSFSNREDEEEETRTPGTFVDDERLIAGSTHIAPSGAPSFCLGAVGSAAVKMEIDGVSYSIVPRAADTCFEIFRTGNATERALILVSGSADISTAASKAAMLMARNTDLVLKDASTTNATIRATFDPVCTTLRVAVQAGNPSVPAWMMSTPPAGTCPADALTPEQAQFLFPGPIACDPSALVLKGTFAKLTLKHKQNLAVGQEYYVVAAHEAFGLFQNSAAHGWEPLSDPFGPHFVATAAGIQTMTLVDAMDISGLPDTEVYVGYGSDAEEMLMEGRYCGAFRIAP